MKREVVKLNETRTVEFRNCSFDELIFDAYILADAVNTDLNDTTVDYSKIVVKITAEQGGQPVQVYAGQLKPVVFFDALRKGIFAQLWDSSGYSNGTKLLAHGAADKDTRIVPARIAIPGGVNLKGADRWIVEIQVNDGAFHANCDSASYIYVTANPAVCSQKFIPRWRFHWLESSRDEFSEMLGDNILAIGLINTDKTSSTTADQIFTQVELTSDRLSESIPYSIAVADRTRLAPQYNDDAVNLYQNFVFHNGLELDDVNFKLTLASGEVVANKNYIVVESFVAVPSVAQSGFRRDKKHYAENLSKLGL